MALLTQVTRTVLLSVSVAFSFLPWLLALVLLDFLASATSASSAWATTIAATSASRPARTGARAFAATAALSAPCGTLFAGWFLNCSHGGRGLHPALANRLLHGHILAEQSLLHLLLRDASA